MFFEHRKREEVGGFAQLVAVIHEAPASRERFTSSLSLTTASESEAQRCTYWVEPYEIDIFVDQNGVMAILYGLA